MAYDALAESIALIESRHLVRVERLSRRRRFVAMSLDVADDLAVTSFARRGVGRTWHDTHVLARREGHWVLLGGSGSSGDDQGELLADRPHELLEWSAAASRFVTTAASLTTAGTGGVHDSRGGSGRWPWSGRWVRHTDVRTSATAATLTIGNRILPVPWHGRMAVVWTGRRGPLVVARDRDGQRLDQVVLTDRP